MADKLQGLLDVINSSRFQAVIGIVILFYLKAKFGFDETIADGLIGMLAAYVGIRTVDRSVDAIAGTKS